MTLCSVLSCSVFCECLRILMRAFGRADGQPVVAKDVPETLPSSVGMLS